MMTIVDKVMIIPNSRTEVDLGLVGLYRRG